MALSPEKSDQPRGIHVCFGVFRGSQREVGWNVRFKELRILIVE